MKFTLKLGAVFVAALLAATSQLKAQDLWTAGTDTWFDAGNWSGGIPTALLNTQINNAGTAKVDGTGNAAATKNFTLGTNVGDSGTVRVINDNTLSVNGAFIIGQFGSGTAVLSDTSVTSSTGNVIVSNQTGSTGSLTVRDTATLNVGHDFVVGNMTGSNGTVDVSAGPFTFGINAAHDLIVGNTGTGMLTVHNGGSVGASNALIIGNNAGGVGTIIVNNAVLGANSNIVVGDAGQGDLELRNGALGQTTANVEIARQAGSVGTVLVNGSTLDVNTQNLFVGGGAGGPGGQGELRIVNGGEVDVNTDAVVWGPGTGSRGELSVDSTYTLNVGGTLRFVGGQLNFLGDGVDFINDATLHNAPGPDQNGMFANVGDGNTATISGDLSGNGQLVKTGTGTLILTNLNNSYTGGTDINKGTVVVGDTAGFAPASVFGDGPVNLNGDINTRLRTPEGTPLLYVILGDFNANTGQLYTQVGGTNSGGNSDEMVVAGNANLDSANSHLFVHRINGYNPNNGDVVTIIDTFGAVNGQFSDAPPNAPAPNDFLGLIQPFAVYGADFVELDFGFAATFASVAKTPNQIATAEALDAAVAAGCIVNATNVLGNVPTTLLRHIYDLIAPEELASMYEASFGQSMAQSLNLQHRMDDIRWGSTGFCADGFVVQDNHGYTKNDGKSVADKNPVEQVAPPNYRWGSFITGTGELTKVGQEDDNAAGYQLNNASFTMGVDYRVTDHWAIGLSGGYTHTSGQLVNDGHLNTDGGRLGLYTTWGSGGFYVDASATGGWNQYDTRRTGYLGQDEGSTDGAEFDGMIAAGYDWKRGCWIFGPYADFEYSYVEFNSFSEDDRASSSSLIPLHYPDQNETAYRTNLGLRIAHEQVMKPGEGLTVVPEMRVAWRHEFGDNSYAIQSNFIGCDDVFTVHGPWIGSDSAVVDLGLTAYCTQQLSASIFYQGQFGRDNYNNNAISGGIRWAF